jgi:endo-1,4-beta-mannosidase
MPTQPSKIRPFRLGVNYWPANSAMSFWQNWQEATLHEDFARMKAIGLDSVRLFLTWEDFQPSPTMVNRQAIDRLVKTCNSALQAGLDVMPTLFTGHMSGANWLPDWALGGDVPNTRFRSISSGKVATLHPSNWYTDTALRRAQVKLATECASALAGHPAVLAWDLGNENSNCTLPPDKESALSWLHGLTTALRAKDPNTPITLGLHMEDLEEDRKLGPEQAAEACDFLTMHGYPGYASFTSGPTDERLLPFLSQLTRFLGGGKEVFFTEFGVPTWPASSAHAPISNQGPALVSEAEAAAYIQRSLRALHSCGATGAMLWCHSDYSPALFDQPPLDAAPHERSFGLFRADGTAKPVTDELLAFSLELPQVSPGSSIAEDLFIDLSSDEYYRSPRQHLPRLFHRYCAALATPLPLSD